VKATHASPTAQPVGDNASPLKLNVVDSCGWLEYFAAGPNSDFFAPALENTAQLIVPALCIYEVCKRMQVLHGTAAAEEVLAVMTKARVVQLDADQLFRAASASVRYKLSMGDAMVWQTAQEFQAALFTQDVGLKGLPDVNYVETRKRLETPNP
jgi:toxin FitB